MGRVGGLVLMALGGVIAVAGAMLVLTLLQRPLPDLPGVDLLQPWLAQIAAQGPLLPAGSPPEALLTAGWGPVALAVTVAGGLLALAGLAQLITGRGSAMGLGLVLVVILGFALAVALS